MRRSTPPFVILIFGVAAILVFMWALATLGDPPAMKLRVELEKKYATKGFRTQFVGGDDPYVEVRAPIAVARDHIARRELGAFALARYRDLAKQTRVTAIAVSPLPLDEKVGPDVVRVSEIERAAKLEPECARLADRVTTVIGKAVTVRILAPGLAGPIVEVAVEGEAADMDNLAGAIAPMILQAGAGLVIVRARSGALETARAAGPDARTLAPEIAQLPSAAKPAARPRK